MVGPDWNIEASSLYGLKGLRRCRVAVPISTRARNIFTSGVPASGERAKRQEGGSSSGY